MAESKYQQAEDSEVSIMSKVSGFDGRWSICIACLCGENNVPCLSVQSCISRLVIFSVKTHPPLYEFRDDVEDVPSFAPPSWMIDEFYICKVVTKWTGKKSTIFRSIDEDSNIHDMTIW
jgi:hypothetical protein